MDKTRPHPPPADQVFYRTALHTERRAKAGPDDRTLTITFSSEKPISRAFGIEILDHSPGSVRLDRLNAGGAVLINHDPDAHVAVVEKAWIGPDRRGYAQVRFGTGAKAGEIFQDVLDGIRRNMSVGYQIYDVKQETSDTGDPVYRAVDWEPLEVSIVSIPADTSIGVRRSLEHHTHKGEVTMETNENRNLSETERERNRILEITAIGKYAGLEKVAEEYIRTGKSIEAMRKVALESVANAKPIVLADPFALGERVHENYSFRRAILAQLNRENCQEVEISQQISKTLRRSPQGIFVPIGEFHRRTVSKGLPSTGSAIIGNTLLPEAFIDILSNKTMCVALGATVLPGLVGDVSIPRQTAGHTTYWLPESTAPNVSDLAFEQVTLTPRTIGALTQFSRKMLLQSTPAIEQLIKNDLARAIGLGIDRVAIAGTSTNNQPAGILATDNVGLVQGGANGAVPTWDHIVGLETEVSNDNADQGSLAYLTNSRIRGVLKKTTKGASVPEFIWENGTEPGYGVLNGYRAAVSNQVPSNLTKNAAVEVCSAIIFGNWSDLLIGEWGVLDILVDPYTHADTGDIRVRAFMDIDIAVRHPESFAVMLDALTE